MDESQKLLDRLLNVAAPAQTTRRDPNLPKSTSVNGYPLFIAWGAWQGTDVTVSGTLKGLVFLPHLQNGSSGLTKFGGQSAIESPLDMMASSEKPFNCKVSLTGCVTDITQLHEGEFYIFLMALKPAGMVSSGKATPYWDGHLKAAIRRIKGSVIESYFNEFYSCRQQWTKYLSGTNSVNGNLPPLPPLPVEDAFEDEPLL